MWYRAQGDDEGLEAYVIALEASHVGRHNENPDGRNVGDCTVRAISTALGQEWETTYIALALQGYLMGDMPSANHVWGPISGRKASGGPLSPTSARTVTPWRISPQSTPVAHISWPCPVMWCASWTGTITTPGTPVGKSRSITGARRRDP